MGLNGPKAGRVFKKGYSLVKNKMGNSVGERRLAQFVCRGLEIELGIERATFSHAQLEEGGQAV